MLISVTPRDRFGNYVGPGYASLVKAQPNRAGTLAEGLPATRPAPSGPVTGPPASGDTGAAS